MVLVNIPSHFAHGLGWVSCRMWFLVQKASTTLCRYVFSVSVNIFFNFFPDSLANLNLKIIFRISAISFSVFKSSPVDFTFMM